jgi:putative component of membrane protein insertase Oxa1/YidC/SpoIIIJ protein YidD
MHTGCTLQSKYIPTSISPGQHSSILGLKIRLSDFPRTSNLIYILSWLYDLVSILYTRLHSPNFIYYCTFIPVSVYITGCITVSNSANIYVYIFVGISVCRPVCVSGCIC